MKTILITAVATSVVIGAEWQSTKIELLGGSGYKVNDSTALIVSFSHANGWKYGDNFFWVDATRGFEGETSALYGEFAPRLSIFKIAGSSEKKVFTDLCAAGQIEMGAGDFRYLGGVGTSWKIPGFSFFNLNVYVREDPNYEGVTGQVSASWAVPFTLGNLPFITDGFFDFAGAEGSGSKKTTANFLIQPTLFYDLGSAWKKPGHLWIGTELIYWKNKYGIESTEQFKTDELVPQAAVRWVF